MSDRITRAGILLGVLLPAAGAAWAHGPAVGAAGSWWLAWSLDPFLAAALGLTLFVYLRGLRRRRPERHAGRRVEAGFFLAGLAVLVIALQSPVDPLGERSFFMHQIQHLLLRSSAPLLLFLALPQATLAAGLGTAWRRRLAALLQPRALHAAGAVLLHPVTVTVLFIAAEYVWQWPPYFEAALRDDGIHYLMHFTMLGAGLLFWWRVFDDRPRGTPYGARVVMLWVATVANIGLGAYLTLKGYVLYPVYDELGRLWVSGPVDELLGGIVVWIPGSNMALIGLLVVLRRWGRREERDRWQQMMSAAQAEPQPEGMPDTPLGTARMPAYARVAQRRGARLAALLGVLAGGTFLLFVGYIGFRLAGVT